MKLYAPNYYKKFVCIADKCKHSCCVGWEIDIDEYTVDKYNKLKSDYAKKLINSISFEGVPHFKLSSNDRCPHLNCQGLCNIILNVGEDYLCDICREHPRFYNDTMHGKEVGLGLSCEEACRLILTSDEYDKFYILEELNDSGVETSFDAINERNITYKILSNRSVSYKERLESICQTYDIGFNNFTDEEITDLIMSLEYLDDAHKEAFSCISLNLQTPPEVELFCERFLAYGVYRHCSGADGMEDYRASLFFALFCERLFTSLIAKSNDFSFDNVAETARIISEEIEYSEDNTEVIKYSFL